jgi:hypothetical protein
LSELLPRLDPNKPEDPTEQQMDEFWDAYKTGGQQGILEFLKKQSEEQGYIELSGLPL